MEYIDVLNENGVRTGEILTRDEVHIGGGKWHRSVIAVLIDTKNRIFMQQRSFKKDKFPGLWDLSVAAHVMSGEDAITALIREFNEEIGVIISRNIQLRDCRFVSSFKNIHEYDNKKLGHVVEKGFYEFFVIFMDEKEFEFVPNDGEVEDAKWMSYFEILQLQKEGKLHPRTEWISEIGAYINRI